MRRDDRPVVRERRVDHRQLQRRDLHVALADGQVLVVADRPRPVGAVGDPAAAGRVRGASVPALQLLRPGRDAVGVPERAGRAVALGLELVAVCAPRGVGQRSGDLVGQVDAGLLSDPVQARPVLERAAVRGGRVGQHAEVVEEVVRGDLDRVDQVERAVDGVAGVVPALAAEAVLAGVVEDRADAPHPALERCGGGDRLERRAGRARALVGAVDLRVARVGTEQRVVGRVRHRLGEHVGVIGRQRAHRVDLAVVRVHGHERAAVGRVVVVDRLLERLLADLLELGVERQLQVVARDRSRLGLDPDEVAKRVDLHLLGAVDARAGSGHTRPRGRTGRPSRSATLPRSRTAPPRPR